MGLKERSWGVQGVLDEFFQWIKNHRTCFYKVTSKYLITGNKLLKN